MLTLAHTLLDAVLLFEMTRKGKALQTTTSTAWQLLSSLPIHPALQQPSFVEVGGEKEQTVPLGEGENTTLDLEELDQDGWPIGQDVEDINGVGDEEELEDVVIQGLEWVDTYNKGELGDSEDWIESI